MNGKMAEEGELEQFSTYVDWPTWSNGSSSKEHLTLSSVGDVLICVVAAVLSVVTAGGNLLVVISYQMDRHLQTVTNYFLLSLSVADFTIGAISMPLYTAYLVLVHCPVIIPLSSPEVLWRKISFLEPEDKLTDNGAKARFFSGVYRTLQTLYVLYHMRETPVFQQDICAAQELFQKQCLSIHSRLFDTRPK